MEAELNFGVCFGGLITKLNFGVRFSGFITLDFSSWEENKLVWLKSQDIDGIG